MRAIFILITNISTAVWLIRSNPPENVGSNLRILQDKVGFMQAVIINTLAIAIASLIGLCLRRGMPKRITDAVMQALGLCTILILVYRERQGKNIS